MESTSAWSPQSSVLAWLIGLIFSNVILFVPITLAYNGVSGWTPFGGISNLGVEGKLSLFFLSHNYNPFRLLGEWTLLYILGTLAFRHWPFPRILSTILAISYGALFSFQCYYAFMMGIYGEPPYFQNEWALVQEVVPVFLAGNGISFGWVVFSLFLIMSLLFWITYRLFRIGLRYTSPACSFPSGKVVLGMVLFFMSISQVRYGNAGIHDLRLNSQWLTPRFTDALALDRKDPLDKLHSRSEVYSSWFADSLIKPPNIYLLFLESYGAVPFLSPYVRDSFQEYIGQINTALTTAGWHTHSTYSLAPIKGGRSWLSFSSALFGFHINNQLTYNRIYSLDFDYPHLVRYLNKQGYVTHRINTMQTNEQIDSLIPYAKVSAFHEFDDWILFPDIPYSGYRYNPMGGLPDQFALEYVWDSRIKNDTLPHFVFFITLDSHAPWYPPPLLRPDYLELNDVTTCPYPTELSLQADIMDRYLASINYEWQFLEQFIRTKATENDLFIVIGDHQPPAMEHQIWDQINDFAVPIHVISRDQDLDRLLTPLDFAPGLTPVVQDSIAWRHEGVYSLVRYILQSKYASNKAGLPVNVYKTGI